MLLYTNLPLPHSPTNHVEAAATAEPTVYYKWEYGEHVTHYADSSQAWREYTECEDFVQKFQDLVQNTLLTNDDRAARVERFLLNHALQAGVVKKVEVKVPRNPNKWGKRLAPWFTKACK